MGSDAGAETGPYAVVTANPGSRAALAEQLFTANYPKLAGWVRRLVDDDDTAHEIASEAFVRLLSKWTSPDKLDNPQSYLFMIATNLVGTTGARPSGSAGRCATSAREATPSRRSTRPRTWTCASSSQRLPARLRDPFLLHYYAGFGIKEIAALVKRPEGTVKADLYHAGRAEGGYRRTRAAGVNRATDEGRAGETMRADDERDPLDRWLSQQAPPLPPPPGTFELITRRARRRKLRKLAVTMVSAAAVAAAVAIAVPVGLNLHLTSPSAKGRTWRRRQPDAPDRSRPTGARARQDAEPVSLVDPLGDRPVGRPPVPANFQPSSITFVSSHTAWVIGQAGTPGSATTRTPTSARRSRGPTTAGRPGRAARPPTPAARAGRPGSAASGSSTTRTAGPSAPSCGPPTTAARPGRRSAPRAPGSPTWRRRTAGRTRCGPPAARPRAAVPRPASRPAAPATR